MECSRISKLLHVVYSSDTAVRMLSGKVYARALRAHFLVQCALELIIFQFISPLSLIEQLPTYEVDRKYLCYPGNSNDEQFPDEISKYVDANDFEEFRRLVEQIEQNTTLNSETRLNFVKQFVGNKAKWRISKRVFKKTKHVKFSKKRTFLTP